MQQESVVDAPLAAVIASHSSRVRTAPLPPQLPPRPQLQPGNPVSAPVRGVIPCNLRRHGNAICILARHTPRKQCRRKEKGQHWAARPSIPPVASWHAEPPHHVTIIITATITTSIPRGQQPQQQSATQDLGKTKHIARLVVGASERSSTSSSSASPTRRGNGAEQEEKDLTSLAITGCGGQ